MSTVSVLADRRQALELDAQPAATGAGRRTVRRTRRRAVAAPPTRGSAGRRPAAVPRPVKVVVQPAPALPTGADHPAPMRITRRGRLLVSCLIAGLAVGMFMAGRAHAGAASSDPAAQPPAAPVASVVVQPGDTLWGLAAQMAPREDPRRTVEVLRQLNGLDGGQLTAGQTLKVPAAR